MFQVVQIHTTAEPPSTYAPIDAPQGTISPVATGLAGLVAGALAGAGYVASRKFSKTPDDDGTPGAAATDEAEKAGAGSAEEITSEE